MFIRNTSFSEKRTNKLRKIKNTKWRDELHRVLLKDLVYNVIVHKHVLQNDSSRTTIPIIETQVLFIRSHSAIQSELYPTMLHSPCRISYIRCN